MNKRSVFVPKSIGRAAGAQGGSQCLRKNELGHSPVHSCHSRWPHRGLSLLFAATFLSSQWLLGHLYHLQYKCIIMLLSSTHMFKSSEDAARSGTVRLVPSPGWCCGAGLGLGCSSHWSLSCLLLSRNSSHWPTPSCSALGPHGAPFKHYLTGLLPVLVGWFGLIWLFLFGWILFVMGVFVYFSPLVPSWLCSPTSYYLKLHFPLVQIGLGTERDTLSCSNGRGWFCLSSGTNLILAWSLESSFYHS